MRHSYVNPVADEGGDVTGPNEWNAAHISPLGNSGAEVTAASYTFVADDSGKVTYFNSASAQTATIPPNSSVAYPVGTELPIVQWGAGVVTVAPGSGVTLEPSGDLALTQHTMRVAHKKATDTWLLI